VIPIEVQYTRLGGSMIAYQTFGEGPPDLAVVAGIASHIDAELDYQPSVRIYERLASFSRVIRFDRRGSGASDPLGTDAPPTWEDWSEDLRAVLDAAVAERAAVWARLDGGPMALIFAATYPERTTALILWNTTARWKAAEDYPFGLSVEATDNMIEFLAARWGSESMAALVDPTMGVEQQHRRWVARTSRASVTPQGMRALYRTRFEIDARAVLPLIQVPTLILHRRDSPYIPIEHGRYLAEHIPGARLVEIPGRDLSWIEGYEAICDEIEEFLTGIRRAPASDRVLATVLFTDIVDSTKRAEALGDRRWRELLDSHDETARAGIDRFGGRFIKSTGDGVLATFDGPGKAIRCASDLVEAIRSIGLEIRAGLHTGEVEVRGTDVGGIAVHIGARVVSLAAPSEVLVSRTVTDLVAGSGIDFDDRGAHELKGVPGEWQLFAVRA
jgi:class 3 adenylate cyclase